MVVGLMMTRSEIIPILHPYIGVVNFVFERMTSILTEHNAAIERISQVVVHRDDVFSPHRIRSIRLLYSVQGARKRILLISQQLQI